MKKLGEWIRYTPQAQNIWLIAKEFGYTLREIANLTPAQASFLLAGLEWWYKRR